MKILGQQIIAEFIKKHPENKAAAETWLAVTKSARWKTPHDVRSTYPKASVLGDKHCWFDLNFGGYRLRAILDYHIEVIIVEGIYSHDEYLKMSK